MYRRFWDLASVPGVTEATSGFPGVGGSAPPPPPPAVVTTGGSGKPPLERYELVLEGKTYSFESVEKLKELLEEWSKSPDAEPPAEIAAALEEAAPLALESDEDNSERNARLRRAALMLLLS